MRRVNVIGASGSGKTSVAEAISAAWNLPHIKLDALRFGPNWIEDPDEIFEDRVAAAAAEDRWVMDGNYTAVRPLIWERADTVIWVDLDKGPVMRQVIRRTFRDWARGIGNLPGNRERLRNVLKPGHPIRWSWSNHARFRKREAEWLSDPAWAHLKAVHLRSCQDVDTFLRAIHAS